MEKWSCPEGTDARMKLDVRSPDIRVMAPLKIKGIRSEDGGRRVKAVDDEGRLHVSSLASTPDIDEMDEIVETAAFASSISKFGEIPVMLAFHDMGQPVGLWPEQKVTKAGLFLDGFISSGRPDIQQLVLDGVLGHTSIGFFVKDVDWDEELEVLRIKDLELIEVSLVPVPANRSTFVSVSDGFKAWHSKELGNRLGGVSESTSAGPPAAVEPVMAPSFPGLEGAIAGAIGSLGSIGKVIAGGFPLE